MITVFNQSCTLLRLLFFTIINQLVNLMSKLCFPKVKYILFHVEQRRNYKNVIHAFGKIGKEEGITSLWRGSVATMGRAVVVNVSQLATYSQAKFLIASKCTLIFLRCFLSRLSYLMISFLLNICIIRILCTKCHVIDISVSKLRNNC